MTDMGRFQIEGFFPFIWFFFFFLVGGGGGGAVSIHIEILNNAFSQIVKTT